MGCGSSVAPASSNDHSKPVNNNSSKSNELVLDALKRRQSQSMVENLVSEEYLRDITQFYKIDSSTILGEGISGSVRLCTHKSTGIDFALKTLDKTKLKDNAISKLRDEIRIMAKLDHPNIIRLNEVFEDSKRVHLVVELCVGGELLDRLHQQKDHHYNEKVACSYIKQMLSAINYCHENKIAHRDLKLENFLFESELPTSQLKLIDFGLSQLFEKNELITNPVGTPYYVAPEVLNGAYDNRCDIWSIGVIAFMLISGTPPFYGKTDVETLRAVKIGKFTFEPKLFGNVSAMAKDFISNCLTKAVSKRPTANVLLQHAWFHILNKDTELPTPSLNILVRLQHFEKRSSLTKICMGVIAHTLSAEQITSLREQFQLLDIKNTGEVCISDLKAVLELQGAISAANMEHMFDDIDASMAGNKVKYHEFIAATLSRQSITENNMKVAFEKLSHHRETITLNDLKDMLGKDATEKEIEEMMAEVNVDPKSSGISYSAFKTIMKGGDASPAVNSPFNKYRKKISFGTDGPASRGERKTGSATPLQRIAMQNASSASPATATAVAFSPHRPTQLKFNEGETEEDCPVVQIPAQENTSSYHSKNVGRKVHPEAVKPNEGCNDVPPPPLGPPPSP